MLCNKVASYSSRVLWKRLRELEVSFIMLGGTLWTRKWRTWIWVFHVCDGRWSVLTNLFSTLSYNITNNYCYVNRDWLMCLYFKDCERRDFRSPSQISLLLSYSKSNCLVTTSVVILIVNVYFISLMPPLCPLWS